MFESLEEEQRSLHGRLDGVGIGSFGPAGVHPGTGDYGRITTTPKPGSGGSPARSVLSRWPPAPPADGAAALRA